MFCFRFLTSRLGAHAHAAPLAKARVRAICAIAPNTARDRIWGSAIGSVDPQTDQWAAPQLFTPLTRTLYSEPRTQIPELRTLNPEPGITNPEPGTLSAGRPTEPPRGPHPRRGAARTGDAHRAQRRHARRPAPGGVGGCGGRRSPGALRLYGSCCKLLL